MHTRELHRTINQSIGYTTNPVSLDNLLTERAVQLAGWDFDGTIADTERLHRVTFHAAVQELGGSRITPKQWDEEHFRKAFGLPEIETCLTLASALKTHHPELFSTAVLTSLKQGIVKEDSVAGVAHAIQNKRAEIFDFYTNNLSRSTNGEGQVTLSLSDRVVATTEAEKHRLELLRPVRVSLYPAVPDVLQYLSERGIRQGVCTSSPRRFVEPLLKELGILEHFEKDANVYVDTVQPDQTKPDPYPFMLLAERLRGQVEPSTAPQPANDMLRFENSAGGALSATRAGQGVTIIRAENTASVAGKYQQKRVDLLKQGEHPPVEGEALFVPCLSILLSEQSETATEKRQAPEASPPSTEGAPRK